LIQGKSLLSLIGLSSASISCCLISSLVISLSSCKDDEVITPDNVSDHDYFPLITGKWIEYEVDSIVHEDVDDHLGIDSAILYYHFQIREEVDTTFIDGENDTAYVIARYRKDNDTLPWSLMGVGTAKLTSYSAQEVEENIRFVRLYFPISSNANWNGNAYNMYPEEEYSYEDLHETKQINSLNFNSTITVLQNDFLSNINRIYKKEIYALNTGLIFKQVDSVNTLNTGLGTIILNGVEYRMNITSYGE
jgi:hypothetical protein